MADVRTALLEYLQTSDDGTRRALEQALAGVDLAQARLAAKEDPRSVDALADVVGAMLLADHAHVDIVDAVKVAAQRAPRDVGGTDVALFSGIVVWRLSPDPKAAEPYFRRVRRQDPAQADVLAFYRALFGGDDATPQLIQQLIQVLVQARRGSTDPEQRFELAREVAALAEQRLQSADRAIEMWRSVIREDGADPRATEALMRLYRDSGKWTALVDLLKDQVEQIEDTPETLELRIGKLLEVAALYRDRLRMDTMALATLQRILDLDPTHEESLEALAETYAQSKRWNDLLSIYERRVKAAADAGDTVRQAELLRRVAEIWVDRLGNPQRALQPLSEVLELLPGDKDARSLLARIHEQRRDFRALIALRREELGELTDHDEALAKRIELARLAEERLGDRREAIEGWNDVLAHHGDVDQALAALARLYERENRWANAAEILHRKLETCELEAATRLLNHLGGLYDDRLHSREDAMAVWAELLRLEPGHDKATRRLRDAYIAERRWEELTALYEQQDRVADLVEVLQSAADRIGDVDERVELYRRVASLCQNKLGQPERAVKALERTLAIQPDNLEVARELLPIYREQANWARLMSTTEVLLSAADDDDTRLALVASLQDIAEHKLASPTLMLQWAREAYRIRPDLERLGTLEVAADRADGWDELTQIFEERLGGEHVEIEERLLLLGKLAVIARDRLYKPDDAQRYFRRIVEHDPTSAEAMRALEDIYTSTRRWDDLAGVYRKRLEVTAEGEDRLRVLRALAQLQEQQLGDLAGATDTYQEIRSMQPGDVSALTALGRIYRARGNWSELAEILRAQLDLVHTDHERVPLMFELAEIRANRLQQTEDAVDGFLAVLDISPHHTDAVYALESVRQADPSTSLAVVQGLLPYYRRTENRAKEAEALEIIVANEDEPGTTRALYEQLAAIYEKMPERREDSLRIRTELFRADPSQWQTRQQLYRLGSDLGRVPDVGEVYGDVLARMAAAAAEAESEGRSLSREKNALRRDLLLEYATMLRDVLAMPREAERALATVLDMDETHQQAYDALEELLRGREAHEELVALYRRRIDVTFNQGEQRELLGRIIQISRHTLHDRQTAVATAEELLDLIPDDLPTLRLLGEMYAEGQEQDDYEKLEETLGRQAELTSDETTRRALRVRQAELRIQHTSDVYGAVDLLGQVLGEDPDHTDARMLLEELMAISEVQLQACSLLEPIYERLQDHEGRIRILQARREQAEAMGSRDEAIGYVTQIAGIRERDTHEVDVAFATMRDAFLLDPTRFDTREEVERIAVGLGRYADLVEVWQAALNHERVTDPTLRIDLTTRMARLLDRQLGDQEGARRAYQNLLALDPPDVQLAQEAVSSLCRLHLEAGDGVALIHAKRELLRFTDMPRDQVQIRLEIAAIQSELRDRVGSALTYGEVLDMDPANHVALTELERLFREEKEWSLLVDLYEHGIGVTLDPRVKATMWRQIGELQRDHLSQAGAAIAAFQSVLDLKVGREDTAYALHSLVALYEASGRWADVEESLRRLTMIAETDMERVELITKSAVVVGRHLGRPHDALDQLKRVLDLSGTESRARSEVHRYLDFDDTRERAIQILTPLYETDQNWPALLELEELQARNQPSGRRRLQALLAVAHTHQDRIGDSDKAFRVLCEAMAEAADQPELADILDKVESLGAEEHRAEALLAAYQATVEHILDSGLQRRVRKALGAVALSRLGQLDIARAAYERVLEVSPDDLDAFDALEQIYLRQDAYESLAELLISRAERTQDGAERDDSFIRAAEIYRRNLDRPEDSIQLYERLSAEGLERPHVQQVLEPLYEQTGRWRELAAYLNRKLGGLHGKEAVDVHLRLGRLYGGALEDPETGLRHLSAALRLDPDHAVATEEIDRYFEDPTMRLQVAEILEPVFAAIADWPRLIQIHEVHLQEATDEETRRRILIRIARIEEEQLEDLERAFASYERLFREQPKHTQVRDQLARLAGVLGQTERFAETLTEFVEGEGADDQTDEMLEIVREAADMWSGPLRSPARAVPLLQRILDARPDDVSVFAALESALTQAEMWRELSAAYWREVEGALSEEVQLDLLRKLAALSQELLEDPMETARAFRRMLDLQPDYELARVRLEQIYTQTEQHHELLEMLRERLTRSADPQLRGEISLRIAQLQEGPLEDPDGAVDTMEAMLTDLPDDPQAVQMLEWIAQKHRTLRRRVLAVLRPIYERTDNIRRIVEIDEWQLGQTEDPITRHEIYREMASLLGRSPDTADAAFRTLCRALAEPGPEAMLESLDAEVERMSEELRLRAALADALVTGAASSMLEDDDDRRLALLVRSGEIRLELADADAAAETLRAALEIREDHPVALARMDQALTALGYHEELAGIVRKRADIAEYDSDRVDLLRRLATLFEESLMRTEDAVKTWRDLLDIEPDDQEALRALARSYEAAGSTDELVAVLVRRIESSTDDRERRDLRMQLAGLQREAVKDRSAEIETLRELLGEIPDDDEAMATLARALMAEERHAEAADVVQDRAAAAENEERRATLLLEAARIFGRHLEDVPSALERYERVLELIPDQDGALTDLVGLAKSEDSFEAAGQLVMDPLDAVGRHRDLADVLEARARFTSDAFERSQALQRLAKVRLERLDDPAAALVAYNQLVEAVDPVELDHVLEDAGRLAVSLDLGAEQFEFLAQRAANEDIEPSARVKAARYAAHLAEEVLDEPARALGVLSPLIEAAIAPMAVCEHVERLGRGTGNLEAVERALREAARLAEGPQEQAPILVRLGEILIQRSDLGAALDALRDAFDANHEPAAIRGLETILERCGTEPIPGLLDTLDGCYQQVGDRAGLARITKIRLRLAPETEHPRLLEQLGRQLDDGGGSSYEALEAWGLLLSHDIDSTVALERTLAIAAESADRMQRAVELLLEAVEAAEGRGSYPASQALQAATLLMRELGDPLRAYRLVSKVLEEQSDLAEALDLLVEAARGVGDPRALHDALARAAAAQPAPDIAVQLWADAAALAERELREPATAIDDLEALLAIDETSTEAWGKLLSLRTAIGDGEKLAETLARRIEITDDTQERRELRYRLANLYADRLERIEDAVGVYRDMLTDQPEDEEAMQELEILLRRLERWQDVRDVLESKLDLVGGGERVAVLEDLAQLAEHRLDDTVDAIERYQQILNEMPEHGGADLAVERLLTAEERWVDLADVLEARGGRQRDAGDVEGFRNTSSRLAEMLAERLHNPERAAEILDELLEHDPSYVPALLAKAAVYDAMGQPEQMRQTLDAAAALRPEGAPGAQLHVRLARLSEDEPETRRAHLEKALDLDPANADAAAALLEIARAEERWDQVAYLLELMAARMDDAHKRREAILERVDLMTTRLNDAEGALRVLAGLYEEVQDDVEINVRIADALFAASRFDEAAGMYTWLLEVGRQERRNKTLAHHLTRLARISLQQSDQNGAKDKLLEAYRIDTTNVETLMTLGALHERESEWKDALKVYRTMLLQNADQSGLLRRGDIYVNLARAHIALHEHPKAKAMLRRGLEEDADHPGIKTELAALED